MTPLPPQSTLFPYTTLFRSLGGHPHGGFARHELRHRAELRDVLATILGRRRRMQQRARGRHAHGHVGKTKLDRLEFLDRLDRKSTRLNSSHVEISYAVFCLK